MKRLIASFLAEKPLVVSQEEIKNILFHRDRMLLLNQVTISEGRAVGEYTVPAENCVGHEPKPGMPVMRGVEMIEMAFQLFGIVVRKNAELADKLENRTFAAISVTGAKFHKFVIPGDKLVMEMRTDIHADEVAGVYKLESDTVIAKVDGVKRCMIASVAIAAFNNNHS